jgi:hypothetical protein
MNTKYNSAVESGRRRCQLALNIMIGFTYSMKKYSYEINILLSFLYSSMNVVASNQEKERRFSFTQKG